MDQKGTRDATDRVGLTVAQWAARECARCQKLCDELWFALDELLPADETQRMIQTYTELCDWMDFVEENPDLAYLDDTPF